MWEGRYEVMALRAVIGEIIEWSEISRYLSESSTTHRNLPMPSQ